MTEQTKTLKPKKSITNEKFLILIIVVYSIVVAVVNPEFLNAATIYDMIKSMAGVMIVAMGLLLVMISGGIDVSFTAVAIFSGYTATMLMMRTGINNIVFCIVVACAIGLGLGLLNAVFIHVTKMEPFIITLGTSSLYHGILTTFIGTKNIGSVEIPSSITDFGEFKLFSYVDQYGSTNGLTGFIIIIVLVVLVTWIILHKTMLGKSILALGCSQESARRAGFNIWKTHLFVYGFMGVLGGLYGLVYIGGVNAVNPVTLVGSELTTIGAVIIGGASITGGKGTILGTILGVTLMNLMNTTLIFLGFSSSWNNLFLGIILLLSIAFTSYQERKRNRKMFIFTE